MPGPNPPLLHHPPPAGTLSAAVRLSSDPAASPEARLEAAAVLNLARETALRPGQAGLVAVGPVLGLLLEGGGGANANANANAGMGMGLGLGMGMGMGADDVEMDADASGDGGGVGAGAGAGAAFFALSVLQSCLEAHPPSLDREGREGMRTVLLEGLLGTGRRDGIGGTSGIPACLVPPYVRTKVGVVLALLVRAGLLDGWGTAFEDLAAALLPGAGSGLGSGAAAAAASMDPMQLVREEIYLRFLQAVCQDVVEAPPPAWVPTCAAIKNVIRGYSPGGDGGGNGTGNATGNGSGNGTGNGSGNGTGNGGGGLLVPPGATVTAGIVRSLRSVLARHQPAMSGTAGCPGGAAAAGSDRAAVLSLAVLRRYVAWVDLGLLLGGTDGGGPGGGPSETGGGIAFVPDLFSFLAGAGPGGDGIDATPRTDLAVQAAGCLSELVGKGMEVPQKVALIAGLDLFRGLHGATQHGGGAGGGQGPGLNLTDVDVTHVDAVVAVAGLIAEAGLELLEAWERRVLLGGGGGIAGADVLATLLRQAVALFFDCFAYDDIDVSGAVVPLASRLVVVADAERGMADGPPQPGPFGASEHVPRIMDVMYRQMRYPPDFGYDYEDDEEAEEEQYRASLRKLYQAVIRSSPDFALRMVCSVLSALPQPLSAAPTPDLEAALRLVYHYCEGVRPPPGLKTVMEYGTFREVLVALHSSDIASHPHREVLMLYYDLAVRYYPIFRDGADLLPPILAAISGSRGIQHAHPRMRSRACYLLLKLIKAVPTTLRPYAETAVEGIQGLLDNPTAFSIDADDKLYLFEAIGLLLGKTGMEATEQQRYLTAVMTPHVRSIEEALASPDLRRDPENFEIVLSSSISAIAFLSKGFTKPCREVQVVLLEALHISLRVLQSLPQSEQVRSKSIILLQRMIVCLGNQTLSHMANFLELLVAHCTNHDVVFVAQLLNLLCSKFKGEAVQVIERNLLPFVGKCHSLMPTVDEVVGLGDVPPHLLTEQLSIKKLSYAFLGHVVRYKVTPIFLSSTNIGSLEEILTTMSDGAVNVTDPIMKKTCIQFFCELMGQWAADGAIPKEHDALQKAVVQFVGATVIPGLIQSFLDPSFNEMDAMKARSISEVAKLLLVLRQKRGDAEFEHFVVTNILMKIQSPAEVVNDIRSASDPRSMDKALRQMIKAKKGK